MERTAEEAADILEHEMQNVFEVKDYGSLKRCVLCLLCQSQAKWNQLAHRSFTNYNVTNRDIVKAAFVRLLIGSPLI